MALRLRSLNDNDLLLFDERTGAIRGIKTNAPDAPTAMFAGAPITITGTPLVGNVLTAHIADGWRNVGGSWTRNGVAIVGATALDYELQEADNDTDVTYESTNLSAFYIPPALRITKPAPPVVDPGLKPAVILAAPTSRTVEPDVEFLLAFVAIDALMVGWQVAAGGSWSDIAGETAQQIVVGPLSESHTGRRFRGFAVGTDGVRRYTAEAVITVGTGSGAMPNGQLLLNGMPLYLNGSPLILEI